MFYNGVTVIERPAVPIFNRVVMCKKHRAKRNITPRVRIFSRWLELMQDGEIILDKERQLLYANSKTCLRIRRELSKM